MIIRGYINRQVLASGLAVIALLSLILVSGRVIRYFERAVEGRLAIDLLTAMIFYRLPSFWEILIPLGLFVGLLLALGRMYLDNEMSVLRAAGAGRRQLIRWLLPSLLITWAATAATAFWLAPYGNQQTDRMYAESAQRNSFDLVQPRRFQKIGEQVFYVERMSDDKATLENLLILSDQPSPDGLRQVIIRAQSAVRLMDSDLGGSAIELRSGERWVLRAGSGAYDRVQFDRYRMRFGQETPVEADLDVKSLPTMTLLSGMSEDARWQAEWGRRWSLVALVPIVLLLALPLAQVNPRQGRYLKLLPAVVLYLSYIVVIMAITNGVAEGAVSAWLYAAAHAGFLMLALGLINAPQWRQRRRV